MKNALDVVDVIFLAEMADMRQLNLMKTENLLLMVQNVLVANCVG